jgi:hypothetical protein
LSFGTFDELKEVPPTDLLFGQTSDRPLSTSAGSEIATDETKIGMAGCDIRDGCVWEIADLTHLVSTVCTLGHRYRMSEPAGAQNRPAIVEEDEHERRFLH